MFALSVVQLTTDALSSMCCRIGQGVEPALQRCRGCLGIEAGGDDAVMAEEALQVGDVHAQCEQPGGDRVSQQVRIDPLSNRGGAGDIADDLANTLAGQHVRRWAMALLPAGEQRPSPARADVQPKQLGQFPADRHLASFHLCPGGW
jgi:hypothetical protein